MKCPKCKADLPDSVILSGYAAIGGRSKSEKKKEAARLNGAKGGRPKKIDKCTDNGTLNNKGE